MSFETMLAVTTVAGLATGLGAVPTMFGARVCHRVYDAALGLAAGIMVSASVFGLVIPGLELGTLGQVMLGVFVGGAITLHNAPEGLAMGIAFASGLDEVALLLAVVIGLQNVPDGFAFAVPVSQAGVSTAKGVAYTTLSGVVPQVAAALVGFALVGIAEGVFPVAAGFAAGAMLVVVDTVLG